jgi:hypothetical protein
VAGIVGGKSMVTETYTRLPTVDSMAWKKCPGAKEVAGDGNGNDKFQTEKERLELKIKHKGEMWKRMAMMSVEREDAHSPYETQQYVT